MKDLVELRRRNAKNSGLLIDHTLVEHIHSHTEGSDTCTLADTALQHIEFLILDGELDVLHVVEVLLETLSDAVELCINLRHSLFKALEVLIMIGLRSLVKRVRCTDTCYDVLALSVDEPLTVELVITCSRVTAECHTRSRSRTHITEYHRLYVYCRTPIIRNFLDATVSDGTFSVPALEHTADRAPKLSLCTIREFHSENFLNAHLEFVAKFLELLCSDIGI